MRKLFLGISIFALATLHAQVKEYIGKWDLCKIITAQGDTQLIKNSDPRFISYNFEYNNTFTSFIKEKNEEITGRFGFEFKTKTIKIKNPMQAKTRTAIGDYDIVIYSVTPDYFIETIAEKKKTFSYKVYCRVK
ncbi:MAG TPA: hypothetical protein VNY73_08035 [Bacteroidia bacterium]|jgi:hypothetical protein|nr:hypothetical protein [Bacteroidia bacterium]